LSSNLRSIAVIQLATVATKRVAVPMSNPVNFGRVSGTPGYRPKKYNVVIRSEKRNTAVTIVA